MTERPRMCGLMPAEGLPEAYTSDVSQALVVERHQCTQRNAKVLFSF